MARGRSLSRLAIALAAAALVAAACAAPRTAVAPTTQPSGAPAATASATFKPFIPVGNFTIIPEHAPAGATVTASATGLPGNAAYDLVWSAAEGSWKLSDNRWTYKGRAFKEVRSKLASVTADAAGGFRTTFVVPVGFGYLHDVLVMRGDETLNKFGFNVDMEVSVTPRNGPVGTPITVEVKGLGFRELQNSWLLQYDNHVTGWISGVTTKGQAKFVIPAAGYVGTHVISIIHGGLGWPYLNPQQSPQPDRPYVRVPFVVTPGEPVLPPPVETQTIADNVKLPDRGNLWFEPTQGIVGTKTTLRARGLRPNTDVEMVWHNPAGTDPIAGTRPDTTEVVGKAKTDAKGDLVWDYKIGDESGGLHNFEVRAGTQVLAKTQFLIQPSVQPLKVSRGPAGTEVDIQLNGMYMTETGKIVMTVYDNAQVGYSCAFNTGGNIRIPFRVTGEPGWHFIDLYPGIHVGEEIGPLNYRQAQLTALADHPGERMPIFRLAFYITP